MSSLIDNIYTELSNLISSSFDVCNKTFVNVFRFCSDWNINLMVAEMKLLAKKMQFEGQNTIRHLCFNSLIN